MREADRIGKRVSELRKIRGFSQRQLAKRAHVSYSLITKVESGHAPASPAFIGAVARVLGSSYVFAILMDSRIKAGSGLGEPRALS